MALDGFHELDSVVEALYGFYSGVEGSGLSLDVVILVCWKAGLGSFSIPVQVAARGGEQVLLLTAILYSPMMFLVLFPLLLVMNTARSMPMSAGFWRANSDFGVGGGHLFIIQ